MSLSDATAITVGTTLPPLTVQVTRADLVRYAGASTDFNPIHYSERFAAAVGLPGVIAHGMLTMATALRVVTDWVGDPSQVRSYFVRFTKPVIVPDDDDGVEVSFGGTVTAVEGTLATVSLEASCGDQKVLGAARAEVDLQPGMSAPPPSAGSSSESSPSHTPPSDSSPSDSSPASSPRTVA